MSSVRGTPVLGVDRTGRGSRITDGPSVPNSVTNTLCAILRRSKRAQGLGGDVGLRRVSWGQEDETGGTGLGWGCPVSATPSSGWGPRQIGERPSGLVDTTLRHRLISVDRVLSHRPAPRAVDSVSLDSNAPLRAWRGSTTTSRPVLPPSSLSVSGRREDREVL